MSTVSYAARPTVTVVVGVNLIGDGDDDDDDAAAALDLTRAAALMRGRKMGGVFINE